MSSFAFGNLLRKEHFETIKPHMAKESFIIELNSKWIAYLTENDLGPSDNIVAANFSFEILLMSKRAPILYFAHPEDHGWGFGILENGKIISSMKIDYEDFIDFGPDMLSSKQVAQMFIEQLSGGNPERFLAQPSKQSLEATFDKVDFDKFLLFGLNDGQIGELSETLTAENLFDDERRYCLVDTFKRILGFDMDFISWQKVCDYRNEHFNILAEN